MSEAIHPFNLTPLSMKKAAAILHEEYESFKKDVEKGEWDGAFYWKGSRRIFTLNLIDKTQERKAEEARQAPVTKKVYAGKTSDNKKASARTLTPVSNAVLTGEH